MSRRSGARWRTTFALALLVALAGCATTAPPVAERHPLERAGVPPRLAVVPSSAPPEAMWASLYADAGQGFASGAFRGAALGLGLGLLPLALAGPAAPFLVMLAPGVLAAAAIAPAAGALIGGAATAAGVVPEEKVAEVKRMADTMLADANLSGAMARSIVDGATRFTAYRAEAVEPGAAWRERGYGAAIEVRVTKVGFAAAVGSDPEVALFVAAEARLVDAASGRPFRLRGLVYQSPHHPIAAWIRDGGAIAKLELANAQRTLAERVVDDLLLETEATFGPGSAVPRTCGLDPIRPAVAWSWTGNLRTLESQPASTPVESVEPLLAWQPRPALADARGAAPWARAGDVRYDLRIWNEIDGAPGKIVYERTGLASTEHRVGTPLAPKSRYYWSVRMRYAIDGHPRATRWSAANTPRLELVPPLAALVYYSRRDGDDVVPRACRAEDLDSCGCLDFIPPRSAYRFTTP